MYKIQQLKDLHTSSLLSALIAAKMEIDLCLIYTLYCISDRYKCGLVVAGIKLRVSTSYSSVDTAFY